MKSDEILVKQKGYRFTGAIQQGNGQPSCFIKVRFHYNLRYVLYIKCAVPGDVFNIDELKNMKLEFALNFFKSICDTLSTQTIMD